MATQTPQEIQALIDYAREQVVLAVQKSEQDRIRGEEEEKRKNRELAQDLYEKTLELIPDVLRPFVKLDDVDVIDHNSYYGTSWRDHVLEFHIPGLAPIAMVFDWDKDAEKPRHVKWIVAGVGEDKYDEEFDTCKNAVHSFRRNCYSSKSGEMEFCQVVNIAQQFAQDLIDHQKRMDDDYLNKAQNIEKRKVTEFQQKSEEQALFDAISSDPVAIHLLKAFVLLRDERSHFECQLEDMDEHVYSVENRWSRKAEDLRRQADEAERRATDERSRLESDIDTLESRLKKAERGW